MLTETLDETWNDSCLSLTLKVHSALSHAVEWMRKFEGVRAMIEDEQNSQDVQDIVEDKKWVKTKI